MNFSITQIFALYMILGALAFFLSSLPSILPLINVVLSALYLLFTYNVIQFQTEPQTLVAGTLLIIAGLSLFQIITAKRKISLIAAGLELYASLTAALIYTGLINRVKNLESIQSMIQQIGK